MESGEEVQNAEAMITTITNRGAIDAQREWDIRKHHAWAEIGTDDDRNVIAPELVGRAVQDLPRTSTIVGWLSDAVIEGGGDKTDVRLAQLVWLDAVSPDAAAAEVGIS